MKLLELAQRLQTKQQRKELVQYIGNDPGRFAALINLFRKGPYRTTQHAAWPISHCLEKHPSLILPHLRPLLNNLKKEGLHDAVIRNTLRILQFVELPASVHGLAAEVAFHYLRDHSRPVAIRVFAMTVMANLCGQHPELARELILLIEEESPLASAAFRARGRNILKKLKAR